jgi:hypothetical protein
MSNRLDRDFAGWPRLDVARDILPISSAFHTPLQKAAVAERRSRLSDLDGAA